VPMAGATLGRNHKGGTSMNELLVDFITSLDGYGAAQGWPGFWGLEGPEYLAWLGQVPERDYTILMGANTYRLMYGFASPSGTSGSELRSEEESSMTERLPMRPRWCSRRRCNPHCRGRIPG
jgi:hypothetical protein